MTTMQDIKPHFDKLNTPIARLAYKLGEAQARRARTQEDGVNIMRDLYKQAASPVWQPIPPDEERIFPSTDHMLTKDDCLRIMQETRAKGTWQRWPNGQRPKMT